jgi:glutathione S-transferase
MLEYLSYLSSELHVSFHPLWHSPSELQKAEAHEAIARRLNLIEDCMREMYLFGPRFTVVDAYLFAMLRWVQDFAIPVPPELFGYFERVAERPAVRKALTEEGLPIPAPTKAVPRETAGLAVS